MFHYKEKKTCSMVKDNNKKAFTLSEVIIASFISTLVLGFIFTFLFNMMEWISDTKKEVSIFSSFYEFNNKLNNYRNIYISGAILFDDPIDNDVYLMKDLSWKDGMLLWPINLSNNKVYLGDTVYKNIWLWFRRLSSSELLEISADENSVLNYTFQDDQIFQDLKIKDLKLVSYNSGEIINLSLIVNLWFNDDLKWTLWSDLPNETLKEFNIDF